VKIETDELISFGNRMKQRLPGRARHVFVDETTIQVWSKNPLYVFMCDSDGRKPAWAHYVPADAWRARSSAISTAASTHRVP